MNKEPSWFVGFIYLRPAMRGELRPGTWIACGLGLNFSGASHPLPADALVPRCAFSLALICTRFMDGYYIDLTQYHGFYYLLENVNKTPSITDAF